jgi:hypothetical protein
LGIDELHYRLVDILHVEAVECRQRNWFSRPHAWGMEFPSIWYRVNTNNGVRLDLSDGGHAFLASSRPEELAEVIRTARAALPASALPTYLTLTAW